jgi:hypothetical protein
MVITAVISLNTLAAPLGFLIAGQVLEHWGVGALFTATAAGVTSMALVYSVIVLRHRDADLPPEQVAPEAAVAEPVAP